jgi:peptidoglycan hydrolase CwlO-like protein
MNIQQEIDRLDLELRDLYKQRKTLKDTFEQSNPEYYFKELWNLEEKMIGVITDISSLERMKP